MCPENIRSQPLEKNIFQPLYAFEYLRYIINALSQVCNFYFVMANTMVSNEVAAVIL